eukprot:356397-Chlamydomonas_euryale.AAC.1
MDPRSLEELARAAARSLVPHAQTAAATASASSMVRRGRVVGLHTLLFPLFWCGLVVPTRPGVHVMHATLYK